MQKIDENLRFKCGIYIFINLENGKRYIGSSNNLYNRLHEHYHNLKNNKTHNKHLQAAWNKYGETKFIYGILEYCDEAIQFDREQYYLDFMQPEYNLTPNVVASIGIRVSDETKNKISNTLKNKYASKEIEPYKQQHNWIKCWVYNIRTFKLEAECECLADAIRLITKSNNHSWGNKAFANLFLNRYIISKTKFNNLNELINFVNENFLVANSKWGKYIVIEKNNKIKYYRELITAAQENSSSKSTLSKHGNATKENPYLIRKSNSLFYYTNEYYPITGFEAVPIEKSSELLSGNIGESPEKDNTEISIETKESMPSYSVDSEPLS